MVRAGMEGAYEGMEGSITDFGNRYENAAENELIKGGTQGIAQKACMRVLGVDSGFDM